MSRSTTRALLVATFALLAAQHAGAADVVPYFESSANKNPRSSAGVSVSGDRLLLKADLALQAPNNRTEIVPHVSSAFSITDRIGIETRVDLAEWNSRTDLLEAKFDTRLHFQSPAPFLDELEGRVWRLPDGQSGRILKLAFYQELRETNAGTPLTIRSRATLETIVGETAALTLEAAGPATRPENRRFRLETEIGGLMAGFPRGTSALRLRVERTGGATPWDAHSLAYDHSWKVYVARVGFNVGVRRTVRSGADVLEPSLGLTWRAEF